MGTATGNVRLLFSPLMAHDVAHQRRAFSLHYLSVTSAPQFEPEADLAGERDGGAGRSRGSASGGLGVSG